ncbi:Hypothetical predicted protein, partial [Scomber scombrus]
GIIQDARQISLRVPLRKTGGKKREKGEMERTVSEGEIEVTNLSKSPAESATEWQKKMRGGRE